MGGLPGAEVRVLQHTPAVVGVWGYMDLALDRKSAAAVRVLRDPPQPEADASVP